MHSVTSNAVNNALSLKLPSVSQLLWSGGGPYTANTNSAILGAYDYSLFDIPLSVPAGYHKEYILSAQYFTDNGIMIRVRLNNKATSYGSTWSGGTFRNNICSAPFKLEDIVLETTYGYSAPGTNLYVQTNSGNGNAYIYNVTITCFLVRN